MKSNRQKEGHRTGKRCVHNSASKMFNCLNSQNFFLHKYMLLSTAIYHFVFLLSTQVDSTTWWKIVFIAFDLLEAAFMKFHNVNFQERAWYFFFTPNKFISVTIHTNKQKGRFKHINKIKTYSFVFLMPDQKISLFSVVL